jgi:hypothetical protein
MKTIPKIVFSLLTIVALSCSFTAQAGIDDVHAVKHSATSGNETHIKLASYNQYKTDIHVVNLSNSPIMLKIPGNPFMDTLRSDEAEDLYFVKYYGHVEIVLYDDEGYEFFRNLVPNHKTVTVEDVLYSARSTDSAKHSKLRVNMK